MATTTVPAHGGRGATRGGPFGLGNIRAFRRDPIAFLAAVTRAQGDVARLRFGPRTEMAVVTHPDLVRELLLTHWDRMTKWERQTSVAQRVLGPGAMAVLEGDPWRQNKRLVTPAFHHSRIERYLGPIERHTHRVLDRWSDGDVVDMDDAMTHATMGVIGEILFDIPDFERDASELVAAFHTLRQMLMLDSTAPVRLPRWLPLPRFRREAAAMRLTNEAIRREIERRRRSGEDRGDMLSMLLATVDDEGARLSDAEVRDNLMGLFIAGHETTAVLMTWTLYLIAKQPEVQDRLLASLDAAADTSTLAGLDRLGYVRQVINESLRLYPPAWSLFMRQVVQPIDLAPVAGVARAKHRLEPGTVLVISPWLIHHRADYWEDPEAFRPERFAPGPSDSAHPYAFIPFGGGPRLCAGARLAEMESTLMLATLVRRFRFSLDDPARPVAITPRFTVRPVGGMPVRVHARG